MNKADEMFKELGYIKKEKRFENEIDTIENDIYEEIVMIIELNNPKFYKHPIINLMKILKSVYRNSNVDLSLQELQAINEKIKELGWYE